MRKTIRKTTLSDLDRVMEIYALARAFMRKTGNRTQWEDGYPPRSLIEKEIAAGRSFVIETESGVHAVFSFLLGEDPTYRRIDGAWLSDGPYGTIHRIAGDGTLSGVFAAAVAFCQKVTLHLRVDTHEDNKIMQHVIEKSGFTRCGVILLANGAPRVAFEKV